MTCNSHPGIIVNILCKLSNCNTITYASVTIQVIHYELTNELRITSSHLAIETAARVVIPYCIHIVFACRREYLLFARISRRCANVQAFALALYARIISLYGIGMVSGETVRPLSYILYFAPLPLFRPLQLPNLSLIAFCSSLIY